MTNPFLAFSASALQWGRSTSLRKTLPERLVAWLGKSFNGAAAHRCGKRQRPTLPRQQWQAASMGPQHIAAENFVLGNELSAPLKASMGPQHIAAENSTYKYWVDKVRKLQWGRSTSLRKTQ